MGRRGQRGALGRASGRVDVLDGSCRERTASGSRCRGLATSSSWWRSREDRGAPRLEPPQDASERPQSARHAPGRASALPHQPDAASGRPGATTTASLCHSARGTLGGRASGGSGKTPEVNWGLRPPTVGPCGGCAPHLRPAEWQEWRKWQDARTPKRGAAWRAKFNEFAGLEARSGGSGESGSSLEIPYRIAYARACAHKLFGEWRHSCHSCHFGGSW